MRNFASKNCFLRNEQGEAIQPLYKKCTFTIYNMYNRTTKKFSSDRKFMGATLSKRNGAASEVKVESECHININLVHSTGCDEITQKFKECFRLMHLSTKLRRSSLLTSGPVIVNL